MGPRHVVLDAHPVRGYIRDEPCADAVESLFRACSEADVALPMCAVNWCEVVYTGVRDETSGDAAIVVATLDALPIAVVDVDRDLAKRAALLKAEYALGLGDAFAAALAIRLGLPLMTGDPDFRRIAGLELEWVGEPEQA